MTINISKFIGNMCDFRRAREHQISYSLALRLVLSTPFYQLFERAGGRYLFVATLHDDPVLFPNYLRELYLEKLFQCHIFGVVDWREGVHGLLVFVDAPVREVLLRKRTPVGRHPHLAHALHFSVEPARLRVEDVKIHVFCWEEIGDLWYLE